jgi:hypothetical protein
MEREGSGGARGSGDGMADPVSVEDDDEEGPEEALAAKPAKDPLAPSQAERDAHEATHLPFRSWCAECVCGRRDNPPHARRTPEERTVPEVMMDYAFVRRQDETQTMTVLILKDRESRAVRAWTMRNKGVCFEEAAFRAMEGIKAFGHTNKILVKVDNEPALKALRDEVIKLLEQQAIPVAPPAKESESNGAIENGVKLFKGLLRVHLQALERKIDGYIPSSHPVMAWLVEHVSDVITKYLQSSDGKTGYQRLFGKQVHEEGIEFGEKIMYRLKRSQETNVVLDPRWRTGYWLGRTWGSISHRIATSSKTVVESRAVHRVPKQERWDREGLNGVQATPWQWAVPEEEPEAAEPVVIAPRSAEERANDQPRPVQDKEFKTRRAYLTKADLERWGYTAGCRRCRFMRENQSVRGIQHTEPCRKRLENCLRSDGDPRMQRPAVAGEAGASRGEDPNPPARPLEPHERPHDDEHEPREIPIDSDDDEDDGGEDSGDADMLHVKDEEDDDDMVALKRRGMPDGVARDYINMYELFLVHGASAGEARKKVTELFSPPRVTAELQRLPILNLVAGSTFDLRMDAQGRSWDFLVKRDRDRARKQIEDEKPFLVVGSPPCTYYSILTQSNYSRMDPLKVARRKAEAKVLLDFAMQIYEVQLKAGRHFLHEHPQSASSWQDTKMVKMLAHPRVNTVVAHLCQYGMKTMGDDGLWQPAKKATRFASSSEEVLQQLDRKCNGKHVHCHLTSGRAKHAAVYPPELCRSILRGIERQRLREGAKVPSHAERQVERGCGIFNLQDDREKVELAPDACYEELMHESEALGKIGQEQYFDNLSGSALPPRLVEKARKEEIDFMLDWEVWEEVPVARCWQATGKGPLGGRWVDVNKGDEETPNVRCRYVAKEIAYHKSDEFFAAMPPLETLRMLISRAATGRTSSKGGRKILVIDARKAHLHAMTERELFVDLPLEIRRPGYCGRLKRCLYGTRDASARWEAFLASELKKHGFIQGIASPCCFHHPQHDLRCMVHGDDFVFVGPDADLAWAERIMGESFLVKVVGRLGGDRGDDQEIRVLNRVLRWTAHGIMYEADPRHAEILAREVGAAGPAVRTPGTKGDKAKAGEAEEELLDEAATRWFRSGAARANYLAMDRPEMAFATKELCRRMSAPTVADAAALRRVARYLVDEPRLVYAFAWQHHGSLRVFVDTDFAGCLRTRKSTSGGCAMLGSHLVKHWSTTQKVVTLSSGEAELAGIVKGSAEALGLQSLAKDLGFEVQVRVYADSSAAIGICKRSGIGRVRHLAVGQLWVQEKVRSGEITLCKVLGTENPADILTKHVPRDTADQLLWLFTCPGKPDEPSQRHKS